ncbi:MAG: PilZ domain-containing protein [Synergistaceae bacterium]|nr:PilZ domain-containing protein [Synergistaceae bacterium]
MATEQLEGFELDYTSKLKIGAKGEVVVNAGIYKGRYPSSVQEKRDGKVVGLDHPLLLGALMPAYRDMEFTFVYEDGSALYMYDMAVIRVETHTGIPTLWAEICDEPKRVQRRQFLRVPCFWDILVFHVEYETRAPMSAAWIPAKAVDASLGGFRFKALDEVTEGIFFESGDRLFVGFDLAGRRNFQFGKASRIVHGKGSWEVGFGFDSLPAIIEKKLFEFIRQQETMGREQK